MIMAKDSNNNYVKIEDIKQQNNFFNGISPIKFKGSGENLENYRIYGNTVGGESVGDRTRNLFDENSEPVPGFLNDGGAIATVPDYPISTYDYINVLPNTNYSYKAFIDASPNNSTHKTIRVSYYTNSKVFISRYFEIDKGLTRKTITTPNNCFYVRLSIDDNLRNVMLWRGASDVSVYEPCGYRVPVMVSNGTDTQIVPIYLPEQIRKVDDEAEYIDFEEQKQHFADGTSIDVTLPALPTLSGTNTLSVETNTKPSKVWGKLSDPRDVLYVKDNLGNILFSKYHEIEGESPLIYKPKKAGTLIDYRIYGQTENGESVGDRTANLFANLWKKGYIRADNGREEQTDGFICSGFFPVEYGQTYSISRNINVGYDNVRGYRDDGSFIGAGTDICDVTNPFPSSATKIGVFTVTNENVAFIRFNDSANDLGMKYMIVEGTYTEQTMPDYEPYGYKVPVTVEGKNLLQNTATSQTIKGVTFTVNADKSVTCNGTATDITFFTIPMTINQGTYIVSGAPAGCNLETPYVTIRLRAPSGGGDVPPFNNNDFGTGVTISSNKNNNNDYLYKIRVPEGYTCDNLTFYPMIRKADIEDDTYEPYQVTTPIYLPEQIRKVGDEAEYIDYGEQKLHRVRKNLLKNTASSQTKNGVTFTVNNDGSVTCNGTASNNTFFKIGDFSLASQSYILTGCPSNGGNDSYALRCYKNGNIKGTDVGNGFNINESIDGYIEIRIASGYTCNNLIFYPMIRKADITDDTYESYITSPELDVTLPALPTLSGINTLSVGTAVQPSKINIKGKIKGKIYGWHVDPDISNSSDAVTYLEDAREMFPASMRSTTFDYGSWENAFFMPKPCMLKSNGKVDYYLDPNDYTKKLDGTTSDIANPNYDGNAMMEWPKIWFKYVKGVKKGQGYFYVANYKADGNFHCWCNYDSEDNEIDHFYTAIYNGTSFANYNSSKTYVVNDFAIYNNKLYKCNTAIVTAESFDSTKWDIVSNTAPVINKMRSLSGIRLTNNNSNAQTNTTTEVTRATANNTTSAAEWYIETFSDRLLINGLLVLMGKSLNTQAVFGRGLDTGGQPAKEAYVTGALNDKGLFWGVTENGNSGVKIFGMENFWGCCWHRTAGLITNNHAVKLKLTYGTKDGSTVVGYNQTGNGYIDNGISPYSDGYVQKMSYNKYGFMPAVVTGGGQSTYQSTYYADYHHQNTNYTGIIYALFGGSSGNNFRAGAFYLGLRTAPEAAYQDVAASLSCKPLLN